MDKLYAERAGGTWTAWTYSDGRRVYIFQHGTYAEIERYALRKGYKLVVVS